MSLIPLVTVGTAIIAGSYIGGANPEQIEAGATGLRGRILGIRDGAMFAAAMLPLTVAAHALPGIWSQIAEVFTALATVYGILYGLAWIKEPNTTGLAINRIIILGLAGVYSVLLMWQLGASEAIVAPLLGWIGGMTFGGIVTEDKKLDLYGAVTAFSNREKLTQLSARYGAAAGLLFAGVLSSALGEMGLLTIVIGSLIAGGTAGILSTIGRLNAPPASATTEPAEAVAVEPSSETH